MLEFIGNYKVPSYAVTYLEYGDSTSIDPQDQENIEEWLECEFTDHDSLVFDWQDVDFGSFTPHPIFGLACDTIECEILGHRK